MSAPFERRPLAACGFGPGGTALALDCACNVHTAVDRRAPEAGALAAWLVQSATAFALPDAALPGEGEFAGRSRRRGVALADWRKIGAALDTAAAWPGRADAPADCWIAAVGDALELDPLATRLLALAVHYELDQRVERLFDALSECRGGPTIFHRDPSLIALLLGAPVAEVAARLATDTKLLGSGLLTLDQQGRLSLLDRLVSLIRQDTLPAPNLYDQLLGASDTEPLAWDAFAHLGREAEVAAAVLRAALAGKALGINILLYGPRCTALMLAALKKSISGSSVSGSFAMGIPGMSVRWSASATCHGRSLAGWLSVQPSRDPVLGLWRHCMISSVYFSRRSRRPSFVRMGLMTSRGLVVRSIPCHQHLRPPGLKGSYGSRLAPGAGATAFCFGTGLAFRLGLEAGLGSGL